MTIAEAARARVTDAHRAKWAYVYVRQSSLSQVTRHAESTELQYDLVGRAVALGWPHDRVATIDDDLGKSGTSSAERPGFQRLIAEIGLAHVGLVVSLDASRLARNNGDWYRLLELCALFGTLLADSERLYDPGAYHDRLLLGLTGMMSEAELHHLKMRLHAGERHKAERGELRLPLPAGLTRLPGGEVVVDPDEEVQARLELVFRSFHQRGSAKAVVRYLRDANLLLPTRPLNGPAPHAVVWQEASSSRVLAILKNPAYAGAYVYGRSTVLPERRRPGRPHTGIVRRPVDEWPVLLHNRYPAYVGWEEFLANQARLRANQSNYREGKPGVPRKGQALLQGIAVCGRCGSRLQLRYSGPHGEFPVYACTYRMSKLGGPKCQEVRALAVDRLVEEVVLDALAPDQIAIALATLDQIEHENAVLRRQWELRCERAAYEAERARRQYDAVEPENRLVARTLESIWEDRLRAQEAVEREHQAWLRQQRLALTDADERDILALGQDLPALWQAPTTTAADRKQVLRLLVDVVLLDQRRADGQVWLQINWQTGATSEHWLTRRVRSYAEHADRDRIESRVRALNAAQHTDAEIAAALNADGMRTAHGPPFRGELVWGLRKLWGLPAVEVKVKSAKTERHPARWGDGSYSVGGAAATVGVYPGTIYHWLKAGRIKGHQIAKGMPWQIALADDQIVALRAHAARWANRSRKEAP